MSNVKLERPLELPEYLSPEEMELFMTDPNVRAARREARRAKLAVPAGDVALRGYRRDWLFEEGDSIPRPINIDRSLAALLQVKVQLVPPITDKITERYDIYPYKKSAENYGKKQQRDYLDRVRRQETDTDRIVVFEQGAVRRLEHTRDNLQWNLWLKTQIADWRLAYVDAAINQVGRQEMPKGDAVHYAGEAIADFGYCLRGQGGLLKSFDMDETFARSVEHLGHYISRGNVDMLQENVELAGVVQSEQEKRASYWGERYGATVEAFGNRLPDEELAMDSDLDRLITALYFQDSAALQVGS